jgi:chromate reductase
MLNLLSQIKRKRKMADTLTLSIVTLCGSARADSYNAALIRALPALSSGVMDFKPGPSVADIPIYDGDLERTSGLPAAITSLVGVIRHADGVIIASPEHNYSIPGGLKNLLDWVSRAPNQPFAKKPVLIQSVSGGPMGGVRMQHHLRQVMVFLDARVLPRPEVFIGPASQKFDEAGQITDKAAREAVRLQLAAFNEFIRERMYG